jgi:hypothetical protein
LAIVRGNERDYVARHPGPSDTALVVEVANTTLLEDRELKGRIYARAGVAGHWIINLLDRRIEAFSGPSGPIAAPEFSHRQEFLIGDSVPLEIPGVNAVRIQIADLMP